MPVFNKNSRVLMKELEHEVGKGPTELNIMEFVLDTSLKSICDFLFGIDNKVKINSKEFLGLKNIIERIPEIFIKRVTQPWLRWDPIFLFIYKKELAEINKKWKAFTEEPLKDTKEKYELKMKSPQIASEEEENKNGEPLTILDVYRPFQEKNPQFTEADMRGEMFTLYETGSDTVASIVSFCLMSLAQYPEYQVKLCSEIDSVVGPDDDVTTDHIHKMTYLDQCLKETLRRFTLVPYLLRRTADEVKLSDCTVPADHTIVVSIYGIHMNPKIYPDPERFDPDRFSPENSVSRSKFTFIPFSGGPRDCIGKKYGMMIMKVMLVHILRRYKVKAVMNIHKIKRKLVVALVSTEGYKVELEPRS
ncbi:cytochrome P450 4C1-like [Macrosteles quadrilineatus]|uniref:cytochrome P450 4C1-like n=1 Tax=Macrosteles quadrilineatus TaxID=74068 RepID=UPI0023E1F0E0|nr:cytochrome P450 4C1-like [Macrosteles quadrilineatus]